MQRERMRHASIETSMNVYGRATMSDAKRQADSKVVQTALRSVLSTKAESGASEKAPPLNAPYTHSRECRHRRQVHENVGCGEPDLNHRSGSEKRESGELEHAPEAVEIGSLERKPVALNPVSTNETLGQPTECMSLRMSTRIKAEPCGKTS